jgi:predicted Zn-dependent peptidase
MKALLLTGFAAALTLQAQSRVQTFTLPNGLQVLHLEDHERPLVRALFFVNLDPADIPPGRQGLPQLTLRMFTHSDAADLKSEELFKLLEDSGIHFTQSVTPGGFEWRFAARSRDQDRALGLLADRLQRTIFDPAVLETQRLAQWRQIERLPDAPHVQLRQALAQTPEARPTFASLSAISWEDLLSFRARVFRPDHAVLVLHGDLGLEQAKRLVLLSMGAWTAQSPTPRANPPQDKPASQPALPVTHSTSAPRISAPGADLRLQAVADQPPGLAPETAQLLALLLAGNGTTFPVRVEAPYGCLVATLDASVGNSGVGDAAAAAWALFQKQLETLRQRDFTQADLDQARAVWQKGRSLDTLHPETQMEAALAEARGRGVTAERIQSVSLAALNAGLRLWLDPANLRVGAAGTPEALERLPKP